MRLSQGESKELFSKRTLLSADLDTLEECNAQGVKTSDNSATKKLIAISLILAGTLALVGCTNNSSQPNYDLDTYTLGRSAVFTQRELINEQLKDPADVNIQVRNTLLYNYCDLVARDSIYVSRHNLPQQCRPLSDKQQSLDNNQRQCAYDYHICIKACPLRTDDCHPCIDRAKRCLATP